MKGKKGLLLTLVSILILANLSQPIDYHISTFISKMAFIERVSAAEHAFDPYKARLRNLGDYIKGTDSKTKEDDLMGNGKFNEIIKKIQKDQRDETNIDNVKSVDKTNLERIAREVATENSWQDPVITVPADHNPATESLKFTLRKDNGVEIYTIQLQSDEQEHVEGGSRTIDKEQTLVTNVLFYFTLTNYSQIMGLSEPATLVMDINGIGLIYDGTNPDVTQGNDQLLYGNEDCISDDLQVEYFSQGCLVGAGLINEEKWRDFAVIMMPIDMVNDIDITGTANIHTEDQLTNINEPPISGFSLGNIIGAEKAHAAIWGVIARVGIMATTRMVLKRSVTIAIRKLTPKMVTKINKVGFKTWAKTGAKALAIKLIYHTITGLLTFLFIWVKTAAMIAAVLTAIAIALCGISDIFNTEEGFGLGQIFTNIMHCFAEEIVKPLLEEVTAWLIQAGGISRLRAPPLIIEKHLLVSEVGIWAT